MFQRKSAKQTRELLEYLAGAQQERQQNIERLTAQMAAADEKNRALQSEITTLENLLNGALAIDTYIDLEDLKTTPLIPAFDRTKPELRSYLPKAPSRLALLIPWKKKVYDRQYESAESSYKQDRQDYDAALNEHQQQAGRLRAEAERHNEEIERYQREFAKREPKTVAEYFALVLEKSAFPAGFPQESALAYHPESKQLAITYRLPLVDVIPEAKAYKYDKLRDEITQTAISRRQRRRLYSSALAQISLRTIYEVFTADQTNAIERIAFEGYVDATDPGSGQPGRFCLVDLNITRPQFDALNLESVEPRRCLQSLKARLSSKPDQLLAVDLLALDEKQEAAGADGTDMLYYKERISELEGTIQTQGAQIREMESKLAEQRDRVAELAPELRDEQKRNAELNAEILRQRSAIAELEHRNAADYDDNAELESRPTGELSDTQPMDAMVERPAESDFVEAGLFAPIGSETADDDAGSVRIPPREPEAQTSRDETQKLNLFEVMSFFVNAQGRYVDYIGEGLAKEQINRLVREGKLERHKFHTYKLRATHAGNYWYKQRSLQQDLPKQDTEEHLPETMKVAEPSVTLRSLLLEEADAEAAERSAAAESASDLADKGGRFDLATSTAAEMQRDEPGLAELGDTEVTQRPKGIPDDLLTDLHELVSIMGEYGSETARLVDTMVKNNWECNHDTLEAIFRHDKNVTFVNNIIDKINDRANDEIDHPLIIEDGDRWIVDEEFRDEIEHILKHPGYLSNSRKD